MRLVQPSIPGGKHGPVLAALDAEDVDYAVTEESSAGECEAVIPSPLSPEVGLAAGGPIRVGVTVDRPAGTEHPRFAAMLDRRLTRGTGRQVAVEVRYVDAARTAGTGLPANATGPPANG